MLSNNENGGYFQRQPPEIFYKKSTLKNFKKLTEDHLC